MFQMKNSTILFSITVEHCLIVLRAKDSFIHMYVYIIVVHAVCP